MLLSNFLSRQKHDDSNSHEMISISFNMQSVLHYRYYYIGNLIKYLVQTQSQAKSSGIKLPEVHSVSRGLEANVQPEKQVIKPVITKAKEVPQIKPRLGYGRAGLRCKIKPQISRSIVQTIGKPLKIPGIPKCKTKSWPYLISQFPLFRQDASTKVIDRKMIQDVAGEIPIYTNPVYRPPPKPFKTPVPKFPGSLSDIDPELNIDFEENSPFQEV